MSARLTRQDQLLAAFELAGLRGLTQSEMQRAGGRRWRALLADLEREGHVFNVRRSRFDRRPWRWVHVVPPMPPPRPMSPEPETETVPPQLSLPVLRPARDA